MGGNQQINQPTNHPTNYFVFLFILLSFIFLPIYYSLFIIIHNSNSNMQYSTEKIDLVSYFIRGERVGLIHIINTYMINPFGQ